MAWARPPLLQPRGAPWYQRGPALTLDSSEEPGLRLEDDAFLGYLLDEVVDLVLVRELVGPHQLLPEDLRLDGLPVRAFKGPEGVHDRRKLPPLSCGLAEQDRSEE